MKSLLLIAVPLGVVIVIFPVVAADGTDLIGTRVDVVAAPDQAAQTCCKCYYVKYGLQHRHTFNPEIGAAMAVSIDLSGLVAIVTGSESEKPLAILRIRIKQW